jgi:hypothetical protein
MLDVQCSAVTGDRTAASWASGSGTSATRRRRHRCTTCTRASTTRCRCSWSTTSTSGGRNAAASWTCSSCTTSRSCRSRTARVGPDRCQTLRLEPANQPVTEGRLERLLYGMVIKFVRYLRAKLPDDRVLGPWIHEIRSRAPDKHDPTGESEPSGHGPEDREESGDNGLHS